jgi:energy-coupling factor transporter ATP-binding protein EcfA2
MAEGGEHSSAGAEFVRADLHVHTHADSDAEPQPDLGRYIDAAIANEIRVLAITDHNSVRFVRDAIKAAEGKDIEVIPGIEISTADGHLLALFDPERVTDLESFATTDVLRLKRLSDTELRSERSIIDLVGDIDARNGLAIPAHVDLDNGICKRLRQSELCDLLSHPGLAGLEFARRDSLAEWFKDGDTDPDRLAAWKARQAVDELRARGLARLMSSDAHAPETVGRDRSSRTLTRLRLGDPNFTAIRNSIKLNPKARCKAEAILPVAYRRIISAEFEGGFLDGVSMTFSPNLNCLIGGRGSGKSTALLSIRAALGARLAKGEDPDDPDRMPDRTVVTFIDEAGSSRTAVRLRGQRPTDEDGSPIDLRIADLGQDESGELARSHKEDPALLLGFLDDFIVRHDFLEREAELLRELTENAGEVQRTSGVSTQIAKLDEQEAKLTATLEAAKKSRIDEIAQWAQWLSSQKPLLEQIDARVQDSSRKQTDEDHVDLDQLAGQFGVDLTKQPVSEFLDGEDGLRARLAAFEARRSEIAEEAGTQIAEAAEGVAEPLDGWKAKQIEMEARMRAKRTELEEQGLKVETTAIVDIANRLAEVKRQIVELRVKQAKHAEARTARAGLVAELQSNREQLFEARKATMRRIVADANSAADELTIHLRYEQSGIHRPWIEWLGGKCGFRHPRVARLARKLTPWELADALMAEPNRLLLLTDDDGTPFFTADALDQLGRKWTDIFALQTMRLEDRPQIEVQRSGSTERRSFDQLSAGQQRSVLLSLILCAERNEPLVLDQPEDHLDGRYIADAVVGHLEGAKERRQVLIATHSANLVVLGDAELVIPMRVTDRKGVPYAAGAVDRPQTRDQVCSLLEGGAQAYRKRGERYGFTFESGPGVPSSAPSGI